MINSFSGAVRSNKIPLAAIYSILLIFFLAAAAAAQEPPSARNGPPVDGYKVLTIYHFNDAHSFLKPHPDPATKTERGGVARLASMIKQRRAEEEFLLLCAGDIFQGTLFYHFFSGMAEVDAFNMLGIDAMTFGNHEFDRGMDALEKAMMKANFKLLSANLYFGSNPELQKLVSPYVVIERCGLKVAVIGLTTDKLAYVTNPKCLTDVMIMPEAQSLSKAAAEARAVSDVVVALTHVGNMDDVELAENISNVDIIIGGHTHTALQKPMVVKRRDGTKCIVCQAGQHLNFLGSLKARVYPPQPDGKGPAVEVESGGLIPVDAKFQEDPAVKEVVEQYSKKIGEDVRRVIARIVTPLDGSFKSVRFGESNLCNMIADLMRDYVGADVAFINGGSIRSSVKGPDVTTEDVLTAFPFDDMLVSAEMKGKDIVAEIDQTLKGLQKIPGGFLHVSGGARITISGNLLESFTLNGKPLEPEKTYKVATTDFNANGGDGHVIFAKQKYENGEMVKISDIILNYLKQLSQPLDYRVEGRIVIK